MRGGDTVLLVAMRTGSNDWQDGPLFTENLEYWTVSYTHLDVYKRQVIRQARTVVTWCPGCQAEVDVVLLGEDTAQLLSGLPTGTLHIWSPPEGPVLICLRSLMQRSQSNDV